MKRERELSERRKNDPPLELPTDHPLRKLLSRFRRRSERTLSPYTGGGTNGGGGGGDVELGEGGAPTPLPITGAASSSPDDSADGGGGGSGGGRPSLLPAATVNISEDGGGGDSGGAATKMAAVRSRWGSLAAGAGAGATSAAVAAPTAPEKGTASAGIKGVASDSAATGGKPASKWGKLLAPASSTPPETTDNAAVNLSQSSQPEVVSLATVTSTKTTAEAAPRLQPEVKAAAVASKPIASRWGKFLGSGGGGGGAGGAKKSEIVPLIVTTSDGFENDAHPLTAESEVKYDATTAKPGGHLSLKRPTVAAANKAAAGGTVSVAAATTLAASHVLVTKAEVINRDAAPSPETEAQFVITGNGGGDSSRTGGGGAVFSTIGAIPLQRHMMSALCDLRTELQTVHQKIHKIEAHLDDVFRFFSTDVATSGSPSPSSSPAASIGDNENSISSQCSRLLENAAVADGSAAADAASSGPASRCCRTSTNSSDDASLRSSADDDGSSTECSETAGQPAMTHFASGRHVAAGAYATPSTTNEARRMLSAVSAISAGDSRSTEIKNATAVTDGGGGSVGRIAASCFQTRTLSSTTTADSSSSSSSSTYNSQTKKNQRSKDIVITVALPTTVAVDSSDVGGEPLIRPSTGRPEDGDGGETNPTCCSAAGSAEELDVEPAPASAATSEDVGLCAPPPHGTNLGFVSSPETSLGRRREIVVEVERPHPATTFSTTTTTTGAVDAKLKPDNGGSSGVDALQAAATPGCGRATARLTADQRSSFNPLPPISSSASSFDSETLSSRGAGGAAADLRQAYRQHSAQRRAIQLRQPTTTATELDLIETSRRAAHDDDDDDFDDWEDSDTC